MSFVTWISFARLLNIYVMALRWTCHHFNKLKQPSFKVIFLQRLGPLLDIDPSLTIRDFFKTEEDYNKSILDLNIMFYGGKITDPEEYLQAGEIMRKHRH